MTRSCVAGTVAVQRVSGPPGRLRSTRSRQARAGQWVPRVVESSRTLAAGAGRLPSRVAAAGIRTMDGRCATWRWTAGSEASPWRAGRRGRRGGPAGAARGRRHGTAGRVRGAARRHPRRQLRLQLPGHLARPAPGRPAPAGLLVRGHPEFDAVPVLARVRAPHRAGRPAPPGRQPGLPRRRRGGELLHERPRGVRHRSGRAGPGPPAGPPAAGSVDRGRDGGRPRRGEPVRGRLARRRPAARRRLQHRDRRAGGPVAPLRVARPRRRRADALARAEQPGRGDGALLTHRAGPARGAGHRGDPAAAAAQRLPAHRDPRLALRG